MNVEGTVRLQIPFKKLGLEIEADFLIIKESVPTLQSMKDMLKNGIDISIQGCFIEYDLKRKTLLWRIIS